MRSRSPILTVVCVPLLWLGGCSTPFVSRTVLDEVGVAPDRQLDFWHDLANAPIASNDDAFHALLLFFDGKDDSPNYLERIRRLKERKWLSETFNEPAGQAVSRGTIAVAIVRELKIETGIMMFLTNDMPRYATRELVWNGLLPPSAPYQALSGGELVGVIGRVEDYQRRHAISSAREMQ